MSNHKFKGYTWNLSNTAGGKPKIVDGNGFCICNAPDATINSDRNFKAIEQLPDMVEAMQEFCNRVEAGEVKSTHTYNKFMSILKKVNK